MSHLSKVIQYHIYSDKKGFVLQKTANITDFADVHDQKDLRLKRYTREEVIKGFDFWKKNYPESEIVGSETTFKIIDINKL
jgi:hypothetical protein